VDRRLTEDRLDRLIKEALEEKLNAIEAPDNLLLTPT